MGKVLVIDDDEALTDSLVDGLADRGYDAMGCFSGKQALALLKRNDIDAVVTDLRMPEVDGLELLATSRQHAPERPVIVMTAFSAIDTAIESIRRGAFHYLTKPFKLDELALFLDRALANARLERDARRMAQELREERSFAGVISKSPAMHEVCDLLMRVVDASATVLLLGETGTGKGLLAKAIHNESVRRTGPFVTINCAAIPDSLLESELFGHVRGAFSGATNARTGLFVEASGGTLFLDEIGEMSLTMQTKLLDVLERGVVRALGSNKEQSIDTRVIAATHRDLPSRVSAGLFREDLYYRLAVVVVDLPPLRRRREDIPSLAKHFLDRARAQSPTISAKTISPAAMNRLVANPWPGNVRELKHTIERAALLSRGEQLDDTVLPAPTAPPSVPRELDPTSEVVTMRAMQKKYAEWVLERLGGKKMVACEKLDIDPKTLNRLLSSDE
ncbi:MAG: sigma-54 dependent transcriptional regulator [Polyangiaceae bacterium]